ncbi:MAG: hypothetical protein AABZ60_16545 [Planctomycetota bacterium]
MIYLGIFLIAFASLALEVTLVRLLSVTTWYHLAFFAISTAMLGMTAGATQVYLSQKIFTAENLSKKMYSYSLRFAWSIPFTIITLCLLPVALYPSVMSFFALILATLACALPFFFAGIVICVVLTKYEAFPIGKLYASDLLGASLGCLFVLGGLEAYDVPSFALFCSSIASLAAFCFARQDSSLPQQRLSLTCFLLFVILACANSLTSYGIRPVVVKGKRIEPASTYYLERWNSFSRITVYEPDFYPPHYWGASPLAPKTSIVQYRITIDGDAGTYLRGFKKKEDIEHLRYDVTNVGYYLGRKGKACIIGVGGGRDIQSAILFEQPSITGVELNPIFVDLLQNEFRDFAGIANRPEVTLVKADARSYLSASSEKFSTIQMSLIDTWAATGAGAFSLSENSLYTVEAWNLFMNRLDDNGLFMISRWHNPKMIGETGRVLTTAIAMLFERGVSDPSQHIALITSKKISTLLISQKPFSETDLQKISSVCQELQFQTTLIPNGPPPDPLFRAIMATKTLPELETAISNEILNLFPARDESPYFFNMLRLHKILNTSFVLEGVIQGNTIATFTLILLLFILCLIAIITIVIPLALRKRLGMSTNSSSKVLFSGALYFSLIGCGFMLTEIALIQRLTVLLSHPLYALGILLFTLIASTGIGSFVSEKLPLTRSPWLYLYPLVTASALIGLNFLLKYLVATMIAAPIPSRIFMAVAVISPMGLLLGLFFPTGMKLVKITSSGETPWYWALNGIFGVLCSALGVLISIYVGISTNFYIAACCYLLIIPAQIGLTEKGVYNH